MDLGSPIGDPSASFFSYFLWFEQYKITFGLQSCFLMIFEWKFSWILMSQPLKSIVNTCVFIRFHFFNIFVILMTSGTSWDLILDTFGGLETPFWWFLGVLDMHWNFIDFQDLPKLREPGCWVVNWCTRGYSRTVLNTSLLTCRPASSRLINSWLINCWLIMETLIKIDQLLIYQWKLMKIDKLMMEYWKSVRVRGQWLFHYPPQPGGPWQAG